MNAAIVDAYHILQLQKAEPVFGFSCTVILKDSF